MTNCFFVDLFFTHCHHNIKLSEPQAGPIREWRHRSIPNSRLLGAISSTIKYNKIYIHAHTHAQYWGGRVWEEKGFFQLEQILSLSLQQSNVLKEEANKRGKVLSRAKGLHYITRFTDLLWLAQSEIAFRWGEMVSTPANLSGSLRLLHTTHTHTQNLQTRNNFSLIQNHITLL